MTSWEIWCKAYFLSWMDNSDKSSHSFGTGFEMMQTGYYSQGVWDILNGGIKAGTTVVHLQQRAYAFSEKYMNQQVKEGSNVNDLFYYLTSEITDEEGLEPVKPPMPIIHTDGLLAVVADSDTTPTTITVMWYYLLLNPSKFECLRNEIDAYFPQGDEPLDFTRMNTMPYLNGCINEGIASTSSQSQRLSKDR
ncbi:hypothetical protein PILCRDRAFT_11299 [Piloderma croceum F 1598]|uniref:Cytochrome P450 n=1 Tax=Piloderma croceum (strain F 1598) TaxID=765440 RepID=A0A0C3BLW5_PILCF|nr:hypothetical protein PILCRDRAFT_11299 [Piloderma croceum F 1598]